MRLDRFLANMACGSRNEVKRLIRTGQVMIDNIIVRDETEQVEPGINKITCCGELVSYEEYFYLMLNKPAGILSATEDNRAETVLDLIDSKYRNKGIYPVGRLDKDTEGLLLLTNDGELGHRLLTPKKHVAKKYFAILENAVNETYYDRFREGIQLSEDYTALPAEIEILRAAAPAEVLIIIYEGKFHQIKRMIAALGNKVAYLKRLTMGTLQLDEQLQPGEYRALRQEEIDELKGKTAW